MSYCLPLSPYSFSNNLSPDQRVEAYQIISTMESLKELDIAAPLTDTSPVGMACLAPNLEVLKMNTTMSLRYDASAQEGLVAAIRHSRKLKEFECLFASNTTSSLDPLLDALVTCDETLERVSITTTHPASGSALARLLSASSLVDLQFATVLPRDLSWDFPRVPTCIWKDLAKPLSTSNLRKLRLVTAFDVDGLTEHVVALAGALQENRRLEDLAIESTTGFKDGACTALATALLVHPVLRNVTVAGDDWRNSQFRLESAESYKAFATMLKHKTTGMTVTIGKPIDEQVCKDQRIHYRNMVVQMILHQVGRHDLMRTTSQVAWVRSMTHINGLDLAEPHHSWAIQDDKDWEMFKLECMMWMVRENPLVTKRIRERRKESLQFSISEKNLRESLILRAKISPTEATTTSSA